MTTTTENVVAEWRAAMEGVTPAMETAWLPTPDEIERINAGAPVILRVLGTAHPPVMVEVGDPANG